MRSISVSSIFFCPHHTISKGVAAFHTSFGQLGYSATKQDIVSSWQGKDNCVEWYRSDLVGQIPMIIVLFKGKGCLSAHNHMLCLDRHACLQNINSELLEFFSFFYIRDFEVLSFFFCSFYQLSN